MIITLIVVKNKNKKRKDLSREKKWDLRADLVKEEEDVREREREIDL